MNKLYSLLVEQFGALWASAWISGDSFRGISSKTGIYTPQRIRQTVYRFAKSKGFSACLSDGRVKDYLKAIL